MPIIKCLGNNHLFYSTADYYASFPDLAIKYCPICGDPLFTCNTQEARERWERQVTEAEHALGMAALRYARKQ